jgi:hypothetical protein
LTDEYIDEKVAPMVKQAASEISQRLGYEVALNIEEKSAAL